jgi:hypothetical protein
MATLGILILTVVLRSAAMLLQFDTASGYFLHGALLPVIFNIISVAAVVFFAVFPIFAFAGEELIIPSAKAPFTLCAILPAVASFALAWNIWSEFLEVSLYLEGKELIFSFVHPILSLFLVIFLATYAAGLKKSVLTAISGILSIFTLAIELTDIYNDLYVSMTSPNKTLLQLSCIVAMLYIYCELRTLFGAPQPKFFLFSLSTATVVLGSYTVPSLLAEALGIYDNPYTLHDLFFAAFFLLCLVRFIGIMRTPIFSESFEDADDGYVLPEELEEAETTKEPQETQTDPEEYPQNN